MIAQKEWKPTTFTSIISELRRRREQLVEEQSSVDMKRCELDNDERQLEEERRLLEKKIAGESSTNRLELERMREHVSRLEAQLRLREKELHQEMLQLDEEKKQLKERVSEIERMIQYET